MEFNDATFKAINLALGAASRRQEVLANNLANINTPGYKRKDVVFDGVLQKALDAAKSGDTSTLARINPVVSEDRTVAVRADGNSVDVDQEMAYLAENNIRYNALVQISAKKLEAIKYVVADGR